jgi:GNAT superfamily N-acetyltransferase
MMIATGTQIRAVTAADADALRAFLEESWGSTQVVRLGGALDASALPGFVAEADGVLRGLLTYRPEAGGCEVVTIDARPPHAGTGSRLLEALVAEARRTGRPRLWLVTTNDNLEALRFYQRRGFRLAELRSGALAESRRLKPEIPLVGRFGIELRDELVLERNLSPDVEDFLYPGRSIS